MGIVACLSARAVFAARGRCGSLRGNRSLSVLRMDSSRNPACQEPVGPVLSEGPASAPWGRGHQRGQRLCSAADGKIRLGPSVWHNSGAWMLDLGISCSPAPWDVLRCPEENTDWAQGPAAAPEVAPVPHPDACFPQVSAFPRGWTPSAAGAAGISSCQQ